MDDHKPHPQAWVGASLKPAFDRWVSEANIRGLDQDLKRQLYFWCEEHSAAWCQTISECNNQDLQDVPSVGHYVNFYEASCLAVRWEWFD
ncbi:hypothetical protein FPOAC2_04461 [Fusarium poae]|uniref:hypothetical protein n=1 Tax=Fusarium poae TaxID=36050 RepID=UPI001CE9B656|nr:hypothetical protein FPOAC1_004376 [Fusarium poae]KAG8671137.1 hypothetical protein FPOAC1_004376 [Fusarium poae]